MPTTCPRCGSVLEKGADEAVWRCENTSCPARLRRSLEHFAGRRAMDIEGLGASRVHQFVTEGLVGDVADIYGLRAEALAELDRMGRFVGGQPGRPDRPQPRSAGLSRLLFGLGIRHVGERGAVALARVSGRWRGCGRRRSRNWSVSTTSARWWRARCANGSMSSRTSSCSIGWKPPASRWRPSSRKCRRRCRTARRADLRAHRHPRVDDPRRGRRRHWSGSERRSQRRSAARPPPSSPARRLAASWRRPRRSACRSSRKPSS